MTTKEHTIEQIVNIITEHGDFGVGELHINQSPLIRSKGTLLHLAEQFHLNHAEIMVYLNDEHIDTYELKYEDIDEETLSEILDICFEYQEDKEIE